MSKREETRFRRECGERGAVLAEFAFVLPLLLVLVLGIVEFGIAFTRAQAIEAAAREGGRLASLSTTTAADVQNRVDAAVSGIYAPGVADVAPFATCAGRQGEQVTVTVTAQHVITIPLVDIWPIDLEGEAVFRCEA